MTLFTERISRNSANSRISGRWSDYPCFHALGDSLESPNSLQSQDSLDMDLVKRELSPFSAKPIVSVATPADSPGDFFVQSLGGDKIWGSAGEIFLSSKRGPEMIGDILGCFSDPFSPFSFLYWNCKFRGQFRSEEVPP